MRISNLVLLAAMVVPSAAGAQEMGTAIAGRAKPGHPGIETRKIFIVNKEMGKWWRDPEISKKLTLSDGQIQQLDQIFLEHRMKLIDYGADMEKQDLKLQTLLDADQPDEGQIGSQVDATLTARGKVEREYTFMNLDLRKVLSLDQWRELKKARADRGPSDNVLYFHKKLKVGEKPLVMPLPPEDPELPPLPPPDPTL